MFNITPGEFMIIAVLALIVLGPERLPEMARSLGRMIAKLRSLTSDLQETVDSISSDPSMKPIKDLGELATRPRQKLAEFAAEAEAEARAERIAQERAELDRQQQEIEEARARLDSNDDSAQAASSAEGAEDIGASDDADQLGDGGNAATPVQDDNASDGVVEPRNVEDQTDISVDHAGRGEDAVRE